MKDKVVPNISQVKFKKIEVEDRHRISSISNQTKSVTACNDSLKSRTSNVNAVCATCRKCMFNSNHDACVSKYLNDVNARTKKPKFKEISRSTGFITSKVSITISSRLVNFVMRIWRLLSENLRVSGNHRYTWTLFLRSKDETPEVLNDFLMMIQRNLQALVISVRTDRGTEFLKKTPHAFFKEERIEHQTSTP
ncbi:retrovirus-related pol polyprotein from transposon TNT 1-94 [Tanacetum coccineum]